jgi:hypothetical protein
MSHCFLATTYDFRKLIWGYICKSNKKNSIGTVRKKHEGDIYIPQRKIMFTVKYNFQQSKSTGTKNQLKSMY